MQAHALDRRKNKVKLEITCPVLELPFSNNIAYEYDRVKPDAKEIIEEKWIIAIGDLTFMNYRTNGSKRNVIMDVGDAIQTQSYKNFLVSITNSFFKY